VQGSKILTYRHLSYSFTPSTDESIVLPSLRITAQGRQQKEESYLYETHHCSLLENEPGALSRVVGLFSARAVTTSRKTVAPTEDPNCLA
jgi:hypothetical protein